jgi:hypothetical protein
MQYNKYNINIKRSIVYHNPISIWTQESTVQMSVLTDQMNEDDTGFHYFIMCRESVVIHTKNTLLKTLWNVGYMQNSGQFTTIDIQPLSAMQQTTCSTWSNNILNFISVGDGASVTDP